MDNFEAEFSWPFRDASDVILTGSFDNWSCSIHLPKGASGFAQTVRVPWDKKVPYKFVVDGRWATRDDRPTEFDGAGNLNNVLFTPSKPAPPTMDHPPALAVPQVPIDSTPLATPLPETPSPCSETLQREASKADEGHGISASASDSIEIVGAVVEQAVPSKEQVAPLNVLDVTVEVVELAEPVGEGDSLSATVDGVTSPVCGETTSEPERVFPGAFIIPDIHSDPTDSVLDGAEQPSTENVQVQEVSSPEIDAGAPQIAPIIHIIISPVDDHTLDEPASPSLDGDIAVYDPSVTPPSDAATLESSTPSPLDSDSVPDQGETADVQVAEQENGVDATLGPDTNSSTPNPVGTADTSAADAGPVIPHNEPSSVAPEPQNASAVVSSTPSTPAPPVNDNTEFKDGPSTSSVMTDAPLKQSSKPNTRKKRRSLFAKLKDFVRDKRKK